MNQPNPETADSQHFDADAQSREWPRAAILLLVSSSVALVALALVVGIAWLLLHTGLGDLPASTLSRYALFASNLFLVFLILESSARFHLAPMIKRNVNRDARPRASPAERRRERANHSKLTATYAIEVNDRRSLSNVRKRLDSAIEEEHYRSRVFGIISLLTVINGVALLHWSTFQNFPRIWDWMGSDMDKPYEATLVYSRTAYLIVRGIGLAGLVSAISYWSFTAARSALDQSVRFEKRMVALELIEYLLHDDDGLIKDNRISNALRTLEVWSASVDSAYAPQRHGKFDHSSTGEIDEKRGKYTEKLDTN